MYGVFLSLLGILSLYHTILTYKLMTLKKKAFEKIVGKGENAVGQHFLPSQ